MKDEKKAEVRNQIICSISATISILRKCGVLHGGKPEIYSEYAPYTYVADMKEFIDRVSQLNRIA